MILNVFVKEWIKKTNLQEDDLQSVKQNSTSHVNGHDEQPVRRSIDLTSMFNSEKVKFKILDLSLLKIISYTILEVCKIYLYIFSFYAYLHNICLFLA